MADIRTRAGYLAIVLAVFALLPSVNYFGQTKVAYASSFPNVQVYVGYADNLRGGAINFPNPWLGSPDVTFNGITTGPWDAGAIRIDNPTGSAVTIDSINVTLPAATPNTCDGPTGCRPVTFTNLWGSFTIPAHSSYIVTELTPTSNDDFDTSDYAFNGCGVAATAGQGGIPVVSIASSGITQKFSDNGHVLDTLGYDKACNGSNESFPWTQIGGVTADYGLSIFQQGTQVPDGGNVDTTHSVTAIASSTDVTVTQVKFTWTDPTSSVVRTTTTTGPFQDAMTMTTPGTWMITADFGNGYIVHQTVNVTIFVLPESPVGALALMASSLGALGAFMAIRKSRNR